MFGYHILGFGAGGSTAFPTISHDFERDNTEYLSMSVADYGVAGMDKDTRSASGWFKMESNGIIQTLNAADDVLLTIRDTDKIRLDCLCDTTNGVLITTATYSTATWYGYYWEFDSAESAGNRMRLWVWQNGSAPAEITAFDTDTNPSGSLTGSGGQGQTISSSSNSFDGLLYQNAMYDGVKAGIANVATSGGNRVNVQSIVGLHSLPNPGDSITADYALSADWTDNNTVGTSTDIPS